jgi:hypothetical protein
MFFEILGTQTNNESAGCATTCVPYCAASCYCPVVEEPRVLDRMALRAETIAEVEVGL